MAASIKKDITEDGALVEVDVSGLIDDGKIERTLGLLDTGTDSGWISKKLFDQLGLQEVGTGTFESLGARGQAATLTRIRIMIEEGLNYTSEPLVVGVNPALDAERFQLMLGREFLRDLRFTYDGKNGHFELSK